MWGIALLVSKFTTISLFRYHLNGNCFCTTCTNLDLLTANCVLVGLIGVYVGSIPLKYNCLFSFLVFTPTSAWSNCTHMIPEGLLVLCICISLITFPAPLVMPSSVLVFRDISVPSPTAKCNIECNCLVFLGSLSICFNNLSVIVKKSSPKNLSADCRPTGYRQSTDS